ncbi:hypothetical protein B0H10DRAFT_1959935 [Mycena sp. CBHHK59/15]|nr:hypothetical protein B0H10DRAFT_1959935 [Mycena sp. CBHHK59/15]
MSSLTFVHYRPGFPRNPRQDLYNGKFIVWDLYFRSSHICEAYVATYPMAAMKANLHGRSVASIIGMDHCSGRSIGYAAVQYHVNLSDANHWEENDGGFDYIKFYNNIVDYFECPPGPVAKLEVDQLLDWWDIHVFGHTTKWSLYEGHGGAAPTSSVARINAAR